MKTWYEILENVEQAKGKQKQTVLKNNDNEILKKVLKFVYDTNITTGISKKKLKKKVSCQVMDKKLSVNDRINSLMDYLLLNNTGKDKDISYCQSILQQANHDEKEWLEKVITKDMKIGITKTTINKVFPDLIPEFKPLKLTKYSSELLPEKNMILPKLDGNYVCVYVDKEDNVKYIARSGKFYEDLGHLDEYFQGKEGVYFGEIIDPHIFSEHTKDFQRTNAILNSKGDKNRLGIALFDMYLENEPYLKRHHDLLEKFNFTCYHYNKTNNPLISVIDCIDKVNVDEKELFEIFHEYKDKGFEGLVIYNTSNIWQPKRVKDILKLKGAYSCDLKVLDVFEHKNGSKLGGVIVDYKGHELKVGSGFSDEEREKFWTDKNKIVGKIIEIEYFTISTNKEGLESLRHPVFKKIRTDKNDVSYD